MSSAVHPVGQRNLILIPHPDDEVVGCAAAIARARAGGARVYALYLGHGYLARQTVWPWERPFYAKRVARRLEEAMRAAEYLGLLVAGQNKTRAAREIWPNLNAVKDEVDHAIRACAPDRIWVPAYEGGNPDHDGLNALASAIRTLPVFEFSEYHFAQRRAQANHFIAPRGDETLFTLTPEEQAMKRDALALYKSEAGNLSAMQCAEESFRPLEAYDYARPPHEGTLWYERFQWVPFKHPRVDFTKSAEVSAAIGKFLAAS
jgi:LmbE family N-acetylglucosaminyl deacetylase